MNVVIRLSSGATSQICENAKSVVSGKLSKKRIKTFFHGLHSLKLTWPLKNRVVGRRSFPNLGFGVFSEPNLRDSFQGPMVFFRTSSPNRIPPMEG